MHTIILRQSDMNQKIPNRAYECPFCGKWHLTSGHRKTIRREQ